MTTQGRLSAFNFEPAPGETDVQARHLGRVPAGVSGKHQLFEILSEQLQLPYYFGRNWDALDECLNDFSWLEPGRIVLVHLALPALPPEDLAIYVGILADAVQDAAEDHPLTVVFPEHTREDVARALQSYRPGK